MAVQIIADDKSISSFSLMRIVVFVIGFLMLSSVYAEQQSVESEVLLSASSSWDGVPYTSYPNGPPELTVLKIKIPANTELPWHTHPAPNAGYVLSGELIVENKRNGDKKILTEGQVLPEMVGSLHRGMTGNTPAVLIVFYAGTKGMPLSEH